MARGASPRTSHAVQARARNYPARHAPAIKSGARRPKRRGFGKAIEPRIIARAKDVERFRTRKCNGPVNVRALEPGVRATYRKWAILRTARQRRILIRTARETVRHRLIRRRPR